MNAQELKDTARKLVGGDKGLPVMNAMNVRFKSRLPWALAFSFARAIQQPALEIWQGKEAHVLPTGTFLPSRWWQLVNRNNKNKT
jgi:fructose-bisphosphate aldolase class 1